MLAAESAAGQRTPPDSVMDASPASGKRRAGGDQHDRESKRPSAERELPAGREPVTGSSSADGARLAPPVGGVHRVRSGQTQTATRCWTLV